MHIVCPHCTTSYAVSPAALGASGRTVRCSRCKEVWLARPEDAIEPALQPVMSETGDGRRDDEFSAEWQSAEQDRSGDEPPHVDSPSIAGDWQTSESTRSDGLPPASDEERAGGALRARRKGRFRTLVEPARRFINVQTACGAMAALVAVLIVFRVDVVRLMPQTAMFYKLVGLDVNLRGLSFRDVKVTTETVEGKSVLVIEGAIIGETRKTVQLPRLRFSVRDAQGAEIYAWNTVLDQSVLKPGERALFKSRLASPPPEGKSIDIRFFNKRDIAGNV